MVARRKYPSFKQLQIMKVMCVENGNIVFKQQFIYKNVKSFKKAMKELIKNDLVVLKHLKVKNRFYNQYFLTNEGKFFINYISEWK
jgi:predicted transcriptional regulator